MFGDVTYHAGGAYGPRIQPDYQLVAVVAGEARVRVEDEQVLLTAGEVGLFLPGFREMFRFSPARTTRHLWCSVNGGVVDASLAAQCARVVAEVGRVRPMSQRLAQILEIGLSVPGEAGARSPGLLRSLGLAALHACLLDAEPRSRIREPDALRRALDWIGANLDQPASLAVLARAAGVSTAQLVKLFRRHLGTTPMRALWTARTEHGVRLLRETGLSVSEIAWRSGFATPFHFSRWVRKLHGMSPRDLRAKAWGEG